MRRDQHDVVLNQATYVLRKFVKSLSVFVFIATYSATRHIRQYLRY